MSISEAIAILSHKLSYWKTARMKEMVSEQKKREQMGEKRNGHIKVLTVTIELKQ